MIVLGSYLATINSNISRCSVIPFSLVNNRLLFLCGKDRESGDITDFGGGIKKWEFALSACLREFTEETRGIFDRINGNDCVMYPALIDNKPLKTVVLFVPIPYMSYSPRFHSIHTTVRDSNEISDLIWFEEHTFDSMICGIKPKLWKRIRNFLLPLFDSHFKSILRGYFLEGNQTQS